eukprot:SAG31_NODE_5048_length_2778_cov_1.677118_2_plen_190_part_00
MLLHIVILNIVTTKAAFCVNCAGVGDSMYSTGDGLESCTRCAGGKQPFANLSGCAPCASGTISPYGSPCTPCPNGTQPDATRMACESCAIIGDGYHSNVATGNVCQLCPNGTAPADGNATRWRPFGEWPVGEDRGSCVKCPVGYIAPRNTLCTVCPDGKEPNEEYTTWCAIKKTERHKTPQNKNPFRLC